jgi:hypothetical protein
VGTNFWSVAVAQVLPGSSFSELRLDRALYLQMQGRQSQESSRLRTSCLGPEN